MRTVQLTEAQHRLLDDIIAYLEQRSNTRDGGDGKPLPNEAMLLLLEMEQVGLR